MVGHVAAQRGGARRPAQPDARSRRRRRRPVARPHGDRGRPDGGRGPAAAAPAPARRAARQLRRGTRARMTTARLAGFATRVLGSPDRPADPQPRDAGGRGRDRVGARTSSGIELNPSAPLVAGFAAAGWLVLISGYLVTFWYLTGQTPGMRFMGIRVTDLRGATPGFVRSLRRLVGMYLAALPLGAGFLLILVDDRRRGLQDLVARTLVIHDAERAQASSSPSSRAQRDGLRARAHVELAIDRVGLRLDRVGRDERALGDLAEREVGREEVQDPQLGGRQRRPAARAARANASRSASAACSQPCSTTASGRRVGEPAGRREPRRAPRRRRSAAAPRARARSGPRASYQGAKSISRSSSARGLARVARAPPRRGRAARARAPRPPARARSSG